MAATAARDTRGLAHHFHPVFRHRFNLALPADGRMTARQRPELALPRHLPAALVVVADAAGTGGKHRGLHLLPAPDSGT